VQLPLSLESNVQLGADLLTRAVIGRWRLPLYVLWCLCEWIWGFIGSTKRASCLSCILTEEELRSVSEDAKDKGREDNVI